MLTVSLLTCSILQAQRASMSEATRRATLCKQSNVTTDRVSFSIPHKINALSRKMTITTAHIRQVTLANSPSCFELANIMLQLAQTTHLVGNNFVKILSDIRDEHFEKCRLKSGKMTLKWLNSGLFWLAVRHRASLCSLLEMWRQICTSHPTTNHWEGINVRHKLEATPATWRKQSCLQTKSQRGEKPAKTQFIAQFIQTPAQ